MLICDMHVKGVTVRPLVDIAGGGNPAAGSMLKIAAGDLEQQCSELIYSITGMSPHAWSPNDRDGDIPSHTLNATR